MAEARIRDDRFHEKPALSIELLKGFQPVLSGERRDRRADVGEDGVDIVSQALHAGGGSNGDQGNDQGVFNEILAFFPKDEAFNLGVDVQQEMVHVYMSLSASLLQSSATIWDG
jgi:hypothetical protein